MSNICQLQYNVWMMLVVVVFGLLKTVGMVYMAYSYSRTSSLLTIGDAIASFLEHKDHTTADMCLMSSSHFRKFGWAQNAAPRIFHRHRSRWWSSTGRIQFYGTHGVYGFCFKDLTILQADLILVPLSLSS
jgi:hypothetical protein